MKKIHLSFLFAFAFLVPFGISFAEDSTCTQAIQFAVSPLGVCQAFPTACDVPTGWKTISSCDLIENKDTGTDIKTLTERRRQGVKRWAEQKKDAALQKKAIEAQKPVTPKTLGGGALTKTAEYLHRQEEASTTTGTTGIRKSFTIPQYQNKEAFQLYKDLNPSKGGYNRDTTTTGSGTTIIETGGTSVRPAFQTSTDMKRTGPLKTFNRSSGEKTFTKASTSTETINPYWQDPYKKQQTERQDKRQALKKAATNSRLNSNKHPGYRGDMSTRRQFGSDLSKLKKATDSAEK